MSTHFHCRSCGDTNGKLVLDLGRQPLANNLLRPEDRSKVEPRFPLRLFVCPSCWLLQITDTVPPVQLFSEYLYFSSFSDSMLRHAREAAERHIGELNLNASSFVVEIASNDGYLLKNFCERNISCLGIEPAENIAAVARQRGVETLADFFGERLASSLKSAGRTADLILANNVFAHVPAINEFVAGLKTLLKNTGRIVLEFPYAADMLENGEFDTIYHEHVFYFSVTALEPVFAKHDLEIVQVERLPIHGGSLRLWVAHRGSAKIDRSVRELLEAERSAGMPSDAYYARFARRTNENRETLCDLLRDLKRNGKRIAAYGASAKGSTLLNYCVIGAETLDFIVDRSTFKQGLLSPGAHLCIHPPEKLLSEQPDYVLLLTWNFADEILRQQEEYRRRGGRFIIPIPEIKIV